MIFLFLFFFVVFNLSSFTVSPEIKRYIYRYLIFLIIILRFYPVIFMLSPMQENASKAKAASVLLANVSTQAKDSALEAMAAALEENKRAIFDANQKDLDAALEMIEKIGRASCRERV